MLATIWNTHYKFSRRYGLDDPTTRFLTCVLLFIVLFYIYPLKFLFTLGINDMIFGASDTASRITHGELSTLYSIYSFGFAGIYLAFTLLYMHAWRLRDSSRSYRSSKNLRPVTSFVGCSRWVFLD